MQSTTTTILDAEGNPSPVTISLPKTHIKGADEIKIESAGNTHRATVPSRTSNRTYTVTAWTRGETVKTSCTCHAGQYGRPCWHQKAVREILRPEVPQRQQSREEVRRESAGLSIKLPYSKRHLAKMNGGIWQPESKTWLMPNQAALTIVRAALAA